MVHNTLQQMPRCPKYHPQKGRSMMAAFWNISFWKVPFASKNWSKMSLQMWVIMAGNPSKNYHRICIVSLIPCYRHSTADWTSMVDLLDCRVFFVFFLQISSEKIATLAPVSREPSTSTKPRTVRYTWKLVGGGPRNRAESGVQVVI